MDDVSRRFLAEPRLRAMPLEVPNLDDHTFDELLAEARMRIARYCPEWTDFNDSDPGMALVQLFAWLTDLMIYKLNQVPERNILTFLKLLNLERRPARSALVQVAFEVDQDSSPAPTTIPIRTKFFVPGELGELTFESTTAVELAPHLMDSVLTFDGLHHANVTATNQSEEGTFLPLGAAPQVGHALYLGFKPPSTGLKRSAFPKRLTLYFFAPAPSPDAPRSPGALAVGLAPPTLVWEYQSVLDALHGEHPPHDQWRPLAVLTDATQSLTREGRIVIAGPGEDCDRNVQPPGNVQPLADKDLAMFWIRCRLAQGVYDQQNIPRFAMVRCNVVELENRATYEDEFLGEGDGRENEFRLRNLPVDPASVDIVVTNLEHGTTEPWIQKDDLGNATSSDPFYTLEPASGLVRFGDGKRGRVPPPTHLIFARSYRAGGGSAGNIPEKMVQDPPSTINIPGLVSVTNPRPAVGGEDEESFEELRERAPRILRGDNRAITDEDYRRHAEEAAGVGRVIVLPLALPQHPGLKIPGAVTVVVIPRNPSKRVSGQPVRYEATPALLELVRQRLDERRPTCVELAVVSPRHREISISLTLTYAANAGEGQVAAAVRSGIDDYFCPLRRVEPKSTQRCPTYRPPRWEVGSPVYFSRLYEVITSARDHDAGPPLVVDVNDLDIHVEGESWKELGKPLVLDGDELPACTVTIVAKPEQPRRTPR